MESKLTKFLKKKISPLLRRKRNENQRDQDKRSYRKDVKYQVKSSGDREVVLRTWKSKETKRRKL